MCGICGFVGLHEDGLLASMTAALAHRGPDSDGFFECDQVGLGHRRLSIIDVTGGRQPIPNEDGSVVLICNGEIYNYKGLREELSARGHHFRTRSDNEVIVHLYEELGPDCVQRLVGMFAFAIYDTKARRLVLARDRLGIKPLYYTELPGRLLFASETKAILRYRGFEPTVNPRAVYDYLALRYVPGPTGMFHEIRKLPAGHVAVYQQDRLALTRYWRPELYAGPFSSSPQEYLERFAALFEQSVRRRLMAEVPLGAYLSGGLDSNVIVATMAQQLSEPIRTFTVGFDYEHDELSTAAATASLLGCRHTEIPCRISDIDLLPDIMYHLDEPVGDPIVIPMFQLAREAKRQVTVVLAGEGADEILGGYLFHKALLMGHRLSRFTPRAFRKGVLRPALAMTPASILNLAFNYPAALGKRGKQKLVDFLDLVEPARLPDAYRHLISLFDARDHQELYTDDFLNAVGRPEPSVEEQEALASPAPFLNRAIHLQFAHWLPDDILTKQDKMSMASAVEVRVPFLDHELVEFALRIPPELKIRGWTSKHLLREYAKRNLPTDVVRRRKMPFYVPIEKYIRHAGFQAMLDDTLSQDAIRNRGLFRPEAVSKLRASVSQGEFVFAKQLFSLVALELWFRMAVDRRAAPST